MSSQIETPIGTPFSSKIAGLGARLEVALLVEHAVVREVHLAVDRGDLAVGEHRGRVVDVVGALGEADECDDAARLGGEILERGADLVEEGGLEQQVLGRVAADRELRKHDQRRSLLASGGRLLRDLAGVARDVTDGGVDLGERDPQQILSGGHAPIIAPRRTPAASERRS